MTADRKGWGANGRQNGRVLDQMAASRVSANKAGASVASSIQGDARDVNPR